MNNETIGISAEKALCDLFGIEESISESRVDYNIVEKMYDSNIMEILNEEDILIVKHIGGDNDSIDFICNNNKSLSLKTLKKTMEKFALKKDNPHINHFINIILIVLYQMKFVLVKNQIKFAGIGLNQILVTI